MSLNRCAISCLIISRLASLAAFFSPLHPSSEPPTAPRAGFSSGRESSALRRPARRSRPPDSHSPPRPEARRPPSHPWSNRPRPPPPFPAPPDPIPSGSRNWLRSRIPDSVVLFLPCLPCLPWSRSSVCPSRNWLRSRIPDSVVLFLRASVPSVVKVFRFSLAACIFRNSSSVCLNSRDFAAWDLRSRSASGPGSNDAASASSIASSPAISSCSAIISSSRSIRPAIIPLM